MSHRGRAAVMYVGLAIAMAIGPAAGSPAVSPSVLTYALASTGTSKIPAFTAADDDAEIMNQIYEALVRVDPRTFKIEPHLATSYTVSPDGKTWTFTLRKGVKWQRGYGEFTCADVQFTWDLHKDPQTRSIWEPQARVVDTVSCPDPYTAVITLQRPFQGFVWNVANIMPSTGWILSKAAWTNIGRAGYEGEPVGTGPYMLRSLTPKQDVILARNPGYWGPRPVVDVIDFKVIGDIEAAEKAIRAGAIDIVQADPAAAERSQGAPGVRVLARPALEVSLLAINMGGVKPFGDVRVRQAIRYAIDYKGLVASVLRGFGSPGYAGLLVNGMTGFDGSVNPQNTSDPAKAKALLKDAGVALPVRGFFTTYDTAKSISAARFIQANLSQVGIDLQPRPLKREALVQERSKTATPASIIGTSMPPDPDFVLSLAFISAENPPLGMNIARYSGIDGLYELQSTATTVEARLGYLRQIQQRLAEDVPAIELWQQQDVWLVNERIQNYVPSVLSGGDSLDQVTLKPR